MDEQFKAVELTVSGTVQDVNFRQWTIQQATQLGVAGWVRNNVDRTVTIVAEGRPDSVESFIEHIKRGPSYGQVTDVDVRDAESHGFVGFSISS